MGSGRIPIPSLIRSLKPTIEMADRAPRPSSTPSSALRAMAIPRSGFLELRMKVVSTASRSAGSGVYQFTLITSKYWGAG